MNNNRVTTFLLATGLLAVTAAHAAEPTPTDSCQELKVTVQAGLELVRQDLHESFVLDDFRQAIARRYDTVEEMLAKVDACLKSTRDVSADMELLHGTLETLSADARTLLVNKYERWVETRLSEIDLLEQATDAPPEASRATPSEKAVPAR